MPRIYLFIYFYPREIFKNVMDESSKMKSMKFYFGSIPGVERESTTLIYPTVGLVFFPIWKICENYVFQNCRNNKSPSPLLLNLLLRTFLHKMSFNNVFLLFHNRAEPCWQTVPRAGRMAAEGMHLVASALHLHMFPELPEFSIPPPGG